MAIIRTCALLALIVMISLTIVSADTPANCTYTDVLGHWSVMASATGGNSINCSTETMAGYVPGISFSEPNVATDDNGNIGNWTLIYNQGVEVWIAGRVYFAYFAYNANGTESYCDRTQIGWAHSLVRNDESGWNCIQAKRDAQPKKPHQTHRHIDLSQVENEHGSHKAQIMPEALVESVVDSNAAQLLVFPQTDLQCVTTPQAFNFTPNACFLPPAPFFPAYKTAMATLDAATNQYKLSFWATSPMCNGAPSVVQYGQGIQCVATGVAQSNIRVNSPITTNCWLEEYYNDDCTGLKRNTYGVQSGHCVASLDAQVPPYMFWISLDQGASWIESQFAANDTDCSKEVTHDEGPIGTCDGGLIITCNGPPMKAVAPAKKAQPQMDAETTYYRTNEEFLNQVNEAQSLFKVRAYPEFEEMTLAGLQRRRGGKTNVKLSDLMPKDAKPHKNTKAASKPNAIPLSWDWRNISGLNFMSPVRDQGQCGSCYSFASGGMMEARIRIVSDNEKQPIISTQDIVSCSQYSQGCEGGFPYLAAGKYGRDFGLAEEACYPYNGQDSACTPNPQPGCNPQRWYTSEYYYIGGYYGESTPELMQQEIMANGPIAVSFEVYDDFMHYSSGVYSHQFTSHLSDSFNPFELTNHVVVIIGWGQTDDGVLYWIVKNSWGPNWGQSGYFWILRGSSEAGGECAIESITVSAIPILH